MYHSPGASAFNLTVHDNQHNRSIDHIDHIDNIVTESYGNHTNQHTSLSPDRLEEQYNYNKGKNANECFESRSPSPILSLRPQHLELNPSQYNTTYNQYGVENGNNADTGANGPDYSNNTNVYDNQMLMNQQGYGNYSHGYNNDNNNNYYNGYDSVNDYNQYNQNQGNYNYDNLNSEAMVDQYNYQQTWNNGYTDNNGNNNMQRDTFVTYPNEQANLMPQNGNQQQQQRHNQYIQSNHNHYRRSSDDGHWLWDGSLNFLCLTHITTVL